MGVRGWVYGGEHMQAGTGRQGLSGGGGSLHNVLLKCEAIVELQNK